MRPVNAFNVPSALSTLAIEEIVSVYHQVCQINVDLSKQALPTLMIQATVAVYHQVREVNPAMGLHA